MGFVMFSIINGNDHVWLLVVTLGMLDHIIILSSMYGAGFGGTGRR